MIANGLPLMSVSIDRPAKVVVAYYSATGHVHALAKAVAHGAEDEHCGSR